MSIAFDRMQIGSDDRLYAKSDDSEFDYKILSVQIIRQAIQDYEKMNRLNLSVIKGGRYSGSHTMSIMDCERFLFDQEGGWFESRNIWLAMAGIEQECFSIYMNRLKIKLKKIKKEKPNGKI